jgi:hypothetical protein
MKLFALLLVLGLVISGAKATDRVSVNMPYPVTIGQKTLPPGEYLIRPLTNGGGSRVLGIFSGDERKHEATVMTIPALDRRTPEETKIVLHRFGDEYYFDKIWIQGKDYGYEFILPEDVKSRMRERTLASATVPARVDSSAAPASTTSTAGPAPSTESAASAPAELASAAPVARAAAKPEPPVSRADPASPAASEPPAGGQASDEEASALPATAGRWMTWLIFGGALTGLGLMARRRRA